MQTQPQTTFHNGKNPFAPKERKPRHTVQVTEVTVVNDPILGRKATYVSKYAELFAQLKDQQALRCKSEHVAGLSKALQNWAQSRHSTATVRICKHYPDDIGYGRVWLLLGGGK